MTGSSIETTYGYSRYVSYQTVSKKMGQSSFSEKIGEKETDTVKQKSQRGTVMAEYYTRKPQYKETQENRVNLGYSVFSARGVSADDIEDMSMEEFKGLIRECIEKIPFDASRPYDEEIVNITKEGWENMKKDPDYAAWVLGIIKENRAVRNPFFGMGDKGMYCSYNFGASPSDYLGQSFSKTLGGTAVGAREKRKARQKKRKELIEADIQAKYMQKKRLDEMYEKEYYLNKALDSSRNTARFFDPRNNVPSVTKSPAYISASYESNFYNNV